MMIDDGDYGTVGLNRRKHREMEPFIRIRIITLEVKKEMMVIRHDMLLLIYVTYFLYILLLSTLLYIMVHVPLQ